MFEFGQSIPNGKFKHLEYSENVNFEGTNSLDSIFVFFMHIWCKTKIQMLRPIFTSIYQTKLMKEIVEGVNCCKNHINIMLPAVDKTQIELMVQFLYDG